MAYTYATNNDFMEIEPELIREDIAGRAGFEILPLKPTNFARVRWMQEDNYTGLQHMRGMDGRPVRINLPGSNVYEYNPGVYGEFAKVTETELTERAQGVTDRANTPIDVTDLVAERDRVLVGRENDRMEWAIWQLLLNGTITVFGQGDGAPSAMPLWTATYTMLTFTASVAWSVTATATPIRDFQSVGQSGLRAGRSVNFTDQSTAWMNSTTFNYLFNNTNANDLGGRRNSAGATLNTQTDITGYFVGQNLPRIRIYDNGWIDDFSTFQPFIPNNKVVVVGKRTNNRPIGHYFLTINANAGYRPTSYRYVKDRANAALRGAATTEKVTPPDIEVHRGHNGGPGMMYPSGVLVMNV